MIPASCPRWARRAASLPAASCWVVLFVGAGRARAPCGHWEFPGRLRAPAPRTSPRTFARALRGAARERPSPSPRNGVDDDRQKLRPDHLRPVTLAAKSFHHTGARTNAPFEPGRGRTSPHERVGAKTKRLFHSNLRLRVSQFSRLRRSCGPACPRPRPRGTARPRAAILVGAHRRLSTPRANSVARFRFSACTSGPPASVTRTTLPRRSTASVHIF